MDATPLTGRDGAPPLPSPGAVPALGVLHVHSDYSHDGKDTLEAIHGFARRRGIGFVGMTEHAEDLDAAIYTRYLEHCRSVSTAEVLVLPGLECRFRGFKGLHLLAFGLPQWIDPRTPDEFIEATRGLAGLTAVAHPRLCRYQVPERVRREIHAIEIWNAQYDTRWLPDPAALRLFAALRRERAELIAFAGLDQHDSRNDRQTRVRLNGPSMDPLAELRAGRFHSFGRTLRFEAAPGWGPFRMGTLTAVRRAFDRIERTQEQLARRRRRN